MDYGEPPTLERIDLDVNQYHGRGNSIDGIQNTDSIQGNDDNQNGDEMPELMSLSDSSDEDREYYEQSEDGIAWTSDWEVEENPTDDDNAPTVQRLIPGQPDASNHESVMFGESYASGRLMSAMPRPQRSVTERRGEHNRHSHAAALNLLESLLGSLPDEILEPVEEDPERAKVLVNGLDKLSRGLLLRMARVGGAPGGYEESGDVEDIPSGCAICWLPLFSEGDEEAFENNHVVSLPCAHVFHAACVLPWFSQKTSCPTCRFNIDPHGLTRTHRRLRNQRNHAQQADDQINHNEEELLLYDSVDDIQRLMESLQLHISENFTSSSMTFAIHGHLQMDEQEGPGERLHQGRFSPSARPKWEVPKCPGPSLRETIETKERDQGLRCFYKTCIFAPTDDNPQPEEARLVKQISIQIEGGPVDVCKHTMHPACLVLSERATSSKRVLNTSARVIEVGCSCGLTGTVAEEIWKEGELWLEVC